MPDFFEKLRKESKVKRQKFALTLSAIISILILGGWAVVTWNNFNTSKEIVEKDSELISPLASIKRSFQNLRESSSSKFEDLKRDFELEADFFTEVVDFEEGEYNDIKPQGKNNENISTSTGETNASSTNQTLDNNIEE